MSALAIVVVTGTNLAASADTITFDGMTTADTAFVPGVYRGFEFGDGALFVVSDNLYTAPTAQDGFGNTYGSPSGAYAASNVDGDGPLSIARPGQPFDFNGVSVSSFAFQNAYNPGSDNVTGNDDDQSAVALTIQGFRGGQFVGQVTADVLSPDRYTFVGASFTDIDEVAFLPAGAGTQAYFLLDDFTYTDAVPEPACGGAMLLLAIGLPRRRHPR
jgi:hypothetical protein